MKDEELDRAIEAIKAAPKVDVKGKQYAQVATRVEVFRKHFGLDFGIDTEVLESFDPELVRVKASILDANNRIVASGLAEEDRRDGYINRTSAIENCETSAIGRALAAFGLMGGEYASSNEMDVAMAPRPTKQVQLEQNWDRHVGNGADERAMVNARPTNIPHVPQTRGLRGPVPQFQQWTDMLAEVATITDHIVHVNTIDDLTRYWAELTDFSKAVQEKDPPLFSEMRAAFSVRNKQLRMAK